MSPTEKRKWNADVPIKDPLSDEHIGTLDLSLYFQNKPGRSVRQGKLMMKGDLLPETISVPFESLQ